jgi:drug/metabolite transporter superfamily protein YnfA
LMSKLALASEIWMFLRQNKKLWLLPIIVVLLLLGALLVFAQSSALAPFIYTIF